MSPYMFLMMPFMLLLGWVGGDGSLGMGMMGHPMMLGAAGDRWAGVEVRYLPLAAVTGPGLPAPGTVPPRTLLAGLDVRRGGQGWFSLGLQGNVGVQLAPPADVGNWVTPYGGIVPRVGTSLGPLRLAAGLLAGGGIMGRQVAGTGATVLEVRPIWALEPRLELGLEGDRIGGALVGSFLLTPYPGDFGGLSAGVRLSFKSGGGPEKPHADHGPDQGSGAGHGPHCH